MSTILLALEPEAVQPYLDEIRQVAPDRRLLVTSDKAEIEAALDEIEIAAGGLDRALLMRAPRLRWLQQWGAGADWLLRHADARQKDFILTNLSGVHAIPISEHIIAFMLALARQLPQAVRAQERKEWQRSEGEGVFELAGKTVLLLGVGAIGERTAMLAKALEMRVIGVRRDPSVPARGVDAMHGPEQWRDLLPQADFLVLTVPLTDETRRMIGEPELRAMKPSSYIINIGRGGTIDEEALARALREGWIAGAGLDVFAKEPLPEDSPLWAMENVIVTAHYSGSTPAYNERGMAVFMDNLRRYVAGQPMRNVVDKKLGY